MKNRFLMEYSLSKLFVLFFLTGCALASRETVNLTYQEQHIIQTLQRGPYLSIESNGAFNHQNHQVWEFDIDSMEVMIYDQTPEGVINQSGYSIEVIDDISRIEGILRLYGNGPLNDKFVGIQGLTNLQGAFLKFNVQDTREGAVDNARKKENWEFVSDPIIFRLTAVYKDQQVVSLDGEEFFDDQNHSFFTPRLTGTRNGISSKAAIHMLERGRVVDGATIDVPSITLVSTTVIPTDMEIYEVLIEGTTKYWGVEFSPQSVSTKMKIIEANSFDEAYTKLLNQKLFNWDLKINARVNNRSIRLLRNHQMVLLKKTPVELNTKSGEYTWDETDELIFNPDTMKLDVITTFNIFPPFGRLGITNTLNYDLVMTKAEGASAGIFTTTGEGKFGDKFGVLNVIQELDGKIFVDLELVETARLAEERLNTIIANPSYKYQDIVSAILPYRLVTNMNAVGNSWVQLQEDSTGSMFYDAKNTEIYTFLDIKERTLSYTLLKDGATSVSYYKAVVAEDFNDTNGILLLQGYTSPTFTTPFPEAPMHGRYLAIDRGDELYKTQAKYATGNTIEEARTKRDNVSLFNLHEKGALPSNYRVITQMETFGVWVSMLYTGETIPGGVPNPLPGEGIIPIYIKANTAEWTFDLSGIEPTVAVVHFIDGVKGNEVTYKLENTLDLSATHGVFRMLRIKGSVGAAPDYHEQSLAVRTGSANRADKAFIAIEDNTTLAADELDRIHGTKGVFYTYHARNSVPLPATFVQTIQDISYIRSETTANVPTGVYIPYNTTYYTFTSNPLLMNVRTVGRDDITERTDSYSFTMRDDGGDFMGVFQATGTGLPFHNLFFRIDIQQGANSAGRIRILRDAVSDNVMTAAVTGIVNDEIFSVQETTHLRERDIAIPTTAIIAMFNISPSWSTVDSTDKMYDDKNNTTFEFDTAARSISMVTREGGRVVKTDRHGYKIMENNASAGSYDAVVQLTGNGSFINQYLAFRSATPVTPPNNGLVAGEGTRFAFGRSFDEAIAALDEIPLSDPYVVPTKPLDDANILAALRSYGEEGATPPGFGTPSFVWMRNGSYNQNDTETWTFNTGRTNLTVLHNAGSQVTYNVHMLEAAATVGTVPFATRTTALLYLKSENLAAPYHNRYVQIREHQMRTPPGATADTESVFNVVIGVDRTIVVDAGTGVTLNMRDVRSANIPTRAINLAANNTWVRLDTTSYQLDRTDHEVWEFRVDNSAQIKVTDNTGVEQFYNFVSTDDISTHRGVFILNSTGAVVGTYDNHIVAIGIGGEASVGGVPIYGGTAFDATSMRFASQSLRGITQTEGETRVLEALNNGRPEWNFRQKELAEGHFNPIMQAARIDNTEVGWAKLEKNVAGDYIYNVAATERWLFTPTDPAINNIDGSDVHDVLINRGAILPTKRYGIKLINTSSAGLSAEFQIFRNDGVGTTNTFVALELGIGLNEKLMRAGTGSTLRQAQSALNVLKTAGEYNWATFDRATVEWGVAEVAENTGIWTLQSKGAGDSTELASANTTSGAGHMLVADNGVGKPTFDPANTIDVTFDILEEDINFTYRRGNSVVSRNYGLTRIQNIGNNNLEGVYTMSGNGVFNNQFVYLEIADAIDPADINRGKRARFSVHTSLESVIDMNSVLKRNNTWNLFESEWIKIEDVVFAGAAVTHQSPGAIVALDFQEATKAKIYDPQLTRTYTIIPTATTIDGVDYLTKSLIISNISPESTRDDLYTYETVGSKTVNQWRAIILLNGSGPDGGRYMGLRVSSGRNFSVHMADTRALVEEALRWNENFPEGDVRFDHKVLRDVISGSGILTSLGGILGGMVTLDSDSIYIDNSTTEWVFNADTFQSTVIVRTPGAINSTTTYKTMLVRSVNETANDDNAKGILYLKGLGALNETYVGVDIDSNSGTSRVKFYTVATLAEAEAIIVPANTSAVNFVEKLTVYFPDIEPLITALINVSSQFRDKNWSSLNRIFEQDTPVNTTNIRFLTGREVDIQIGTTPSVRARFKPVFDERNETKTILTFVPKGTTLLPEAFQNLTVALDILNLQNSDGMKFVGTKNVNVGVPIQVTALQNLRNALLDPNYIPKELFDLDKRAVTSLRTVSEGTWRQTKEDGTLAGVAGRIAEWRTLYNSGVGADIAPWSYQVTDPNSKSINISRGSITEPSIESLNTRYEYLVKMIESSGNNNAIFRLYKGGSTIGDVTDKGIYQTEISNKFQAIRVGTGISHFRARIARGTTVAEVRTKLTELMFDNMIAEEVWVNQSTDVISNMNWDAFVSPAIQRGNSSIQWVDRSATDEDFSLQNYEYWTFDHEVGKPILAVHNVIMNGIVSQTPYALRLMQRISSLSGVYGLTGVGIYTDRLLIYERAGLTGDNRNRAAFFITTVEDSTYQAAIDGLNAQKVAGSNWIDRRTLTESIHSVRGLAGLNKLVTVDPDAYRVTPPVPVLDKRNNEEWHFALSLVAGSEEGTVTVVNTVNGASESAQYTLVVLQDSELATVESGEYSGVFSLVNLTGGRLHRHIVAVEVDSRVAALPKISLTTFDGGDTTESFNTAIEAAKALILAGIDENINTVKYQRSAIVETYTVPTIVDAKNDNLVLLDQDRIYLDHDTKEFQFDPNAGSVLITTRTSTDRGNTFNSRSDNYFFNEIKGIPTTAGSSARGMYFLKGTREGSPLHNHFIILEVGTTTDDAIYGKFAAKTTGVYVENDLTAVNLNINLGVKAAVNFNDDVLEVLKTAGIPRKVGNPEGLGMVHPGAHSFVYDPSSTEELYIDVHQRLILYVSRRVGEHATNYMRLKLIAPETADTPHEKLGQRVTVQWIQNSRTDLKFVYDEEEFDTVASGTAGTGPLGPLGGTFQRANWWWAFGIPTDSTGLYLGFAPQSVAQARANRDNSTNTGGDPKFMPLELTRNDPKVSKLLQDKLGGTDNVADWYLPVDEFRSIEPATGTTGTEKFAFRTPVRKVATADTLAVYDFAVAKRSEANPNTVEANTIAGYLTKVISDDGDLDGIVLPHGITSATFASVVSNKYISLRVGTGVDESKIKLAVGNSEQDSRNSLNRLTFWNYLSKSVLDAEPQIIETLADTADGDVWVQTSGTSATPPIYTGSNTTNWRFDFVNNIINIDIAEEGVISSGSYRIQMIEDGGAQAGIFQLDGFGSADFNLKFIAMDNTAGATAKVAIGSSIQQAKTRLLAQTHPNFYQKSQILSLGPFFSALRARGRIAEGVYNAGGRRVHLDSKDAYIYEFSLVFSNPQVAITRITEFNTITHSYGLVVEDISIAAEGYYRLIGEGPEGGRLLGFAAANAGAITTPNGLFKILVEGRPITKAPGAAITPGNVAEMRQQWANINNLHVEEAFLLKDKSALEFLQNLGPIAQMQFIATPSIELNSTGVYDPENTILYNFNATADTLQVTIITAGVQSFFNYYISIVDDFENGAGEINDQKLLMNLRGSDAVSIANSRFHEQYMGSEFISGDKGFLIRDRRIDPIEAAIVALKGRAENLPHSYWSHEALSSVAHDSSVHRDLDILLQDSRSIIENTTPDWSINGTTRSVSYQGIVMSADPRFFKNNGTGTSRVRVGAGNLAVGGYYDDRDTYVFLKGSQFAEIGITRRVTNATGTIVDNTAAFYRLKLVEKENDTSSSFLVLRALILGNALPVPGDAELDDAFLNKVISVDLGPERFLTDGIHIGFSSVIPDGEISQERLQTAIDQAQADRVVAQTGVKQYTPLLLPRAVAKSQHMLYHILAGALPRTFAGQGNLIEVDTSANSTVPANFRPYIFANGTKQLSPRFDSNPSNTNQYTVNVRLKALSVLNLSGTVNESNGSDETDFEIKVLDNPSPTLSIFRFHRPNILTTALSTETFWSNIVYNQVHAVQLGIGAQFLQHKWAYGPTKEQARINVQNLPFFNGGYGWGTGSVRRATFASFMAASPNGHTITDVSGGKYQQDLQALGFASDITKLDIVSKTTINDRYFVLVEAFAGTEKKSTFQYELIVKDGNNINIFTVAFDGFGPLKDYILFRSGTKALFDKPDTGHRLTQYVGTFYGGTETVATNPVYDPALTDANFSANWTDK